MKNYRVCVAEDGTPLRVRMSYDREDNESQWLCDPDRYTHPDTPEEAKFIHYINAMDELGAYRAAREMMLSPKSLKPPGWRSKTKMNNNQA